MHHWLWGDGRPCTSHKFTHRSIHPSFYPYIYLTSTGWLISAVQVRGTELVSRGDPIQLVCNATGRPDPPRNVEWYKDGRLIESDAGGGLIVTKKVETAMLVSVLAIRRSRLSDAGQYFCRSSANDVGHIEVTVINGH